MFCILILNSSFYLFMCLDLVLKRYQSSLFQMYLTDYGWSDCFCAGEHGESSGPTGYCMY